MKIVFTIFFLLLLAGQVIAQRKINLKAVQPRNLVANGSFEDINICTEFQALCEPEAWYYLPTYVVEPQGNDSNRYEVIAIANAAYGGRAGNYLFTKLLCPLQEGKRYRFSIWVNTPQNEFDHLDIYFTYQEPTNHLALNTVTEVAFSLTEKNAEAAYKRWKKYSYTYVATGEERFITLGNFSNDTANKNKAVANNKQGDILYAIDNVSLFALDAKEVPCKEYFAVTKQLYDQNYRHPARMINKIPFDSSLLSGSKTEPLPKTITKTDTLIIPDILFQYNSSKINPAFSSKLQALVVNMSIRHFSSIEIAGHTDNIGSADFNNRLSLQRAVAIRNFILTQIHLPKEKTEVKGMGESRPKAMNDTPEGRKKNRRVEIILKS